MTTVRDIAQLIDHALLHPAQTDESLLAGLHLARRYGVKSVCIKPYAVPQAAEWLAGSGVRVGTVVGFPHGSSDLRIKAAETEVACAEGATEIDLVVNIGKVLGHDWGYVRREVAQMREITARSGAVLKVIFENDFLPSDSYKIRLCEICNEAAADFVKTSTGFGFVPGNDGRYAYRGATESDVKLMRQYAAPGVQVKASGGIRTLDELLLARSWGASRIGTSATATLLEAARQRFGESSAGADSSGNPVDLGY